MHQVQPEAPAHQGSCGRGGKEGGSKPPLTDLQVAEHVLQPVHQRLQPALVLLARRVGGRRRRVGGRRRRRRHRGVRQRQQVRQRLLLRRQQRVQGLPVGGRRKALLQRRELRAGRVLQRRQRRRQVRPRQLPQQRRGLRSQLSLPAGEGKQESSGWGLRQLLPGAGARATLRAPAFVPTLAAGRHPPAPPHQRAPRLQERCTVGSAPAGAAGLGKGGGGVHACESRCARGGPGLVGAGSGLLRSAVPAPKQCSTASAEWHR